MPHGRAAASAGLAPNQWLRFDAMSGRTGGDDIPSDERSAPGWYPDPRGGDGLRFWDGDQWTEHEAGPRSPQPVETPMRAPLAPPAEPVRICPNCSTQSTTAGDYCPHCGSSYVRRRGFTKRRKIVLAAVLGILLLAGAGAGVALKLDHDADVRAERKEREEARERERQRERDRQEAADAQTAIDDVERETRQSLVDDLERSITKDGEKKVAQGLLDGPILRTECTPVGGGSEDLSQPTGKFECLAITTEHDDGTASGYSVDATVNYDDFSYTWQFSP